MKYVVCNFVVHKIDVRSNMKRKKIKLSSQSVMQIVSLMICLYVCCNKNDKDGIVGSGVHGRSIRFVMAVPTTPTPAFNPTFALGNDNDQIKVEKFLSQSSSVFTIEEEEKGRVSTQIILHNKTITSRVFFFHQKLHSNIN